MKSKYVEVGGYRLHYFEALPTNGRAGTPLVLVHGLGARGEDWAAMMPALAAKGFHVYVPDSAGIWAVAAAGCRLFDCLEEADGGAVYAGGAFAARRCRGLVDGWMDCDEAGAGSS